MGKPREENGKRTLRKRIKAIAYAALCACSVAAVSLMAVQGILPSASDYAASVADNAALSGETYSDNRGSASDNAADDAQAASSLENQISQVASVGGAGAPWVPEGTYEERLQLSREMAASVGKPVDTQGALSNLTRADMQEVAEEDEGRAYLTGQVLVLFNEGIDAHAASEALSEVGLSADDAHIQDSLDARSPLMAIVESGESVASVIDGIKAGSGSANIAYAEPNYIYAPAEYISQSNASSSSEGTGEDPASGEAKAENAGEAEAADAVDGEDAEVLLPVAAGKAALANSSESPDQPTIQSTTVNDPMYNLYFAKPQYDRCGLHDAWDRVRCEGKVAVAIVDNGVADHPDLVDNIIPGTGYNSSYDNSNYQGIQDKYFSDCDHGTHVAGIVSARANNGIGVAGTSYNAGIIPIDVALRAPGGFVTPQSGIANALAYLLKDADGNGVADMVEQHNLRVVNISIGAVSPSLSADSVYNTTIFPLIDRLWEQGVLVVCAAGNADTQNFGTTNANWPSDYEKCMSVINVTYNAFYEVYQRVDKSNYGDLKDISAPGNNIRSTTYNYGTSNVLDGAPIYSYSEKSGTSQASPCVAGMAALVFAANPSLTPAQVKSILESTATDIGSEGFDTDFAWGVVNVNAAVQKAMSTEIPDPEEPDPVLTPVKIPQAREGVVYNGEFQVMVPEGEGYEAKYASGNNVFDRYEAVLTLKPGYIWEDGTTEVKRIPYYIHPATLTATYESETVPYEGTPSYKVTVTGFVGNETPENLDQNVYTAPTVAPPEPFEWGTTYHLIPSGGQALNYVFSYVGGDLYLEGPPIVEPTCELSVPDAQFETAMYGYAQHEPLHITVTNSGTGEGIIESITLEGATPDAFELSGDLSSIGAGESSDVLQVAPKAGLDVGEYSASMVLVYDGGKTIASSIRFTVVQRPEDAPSAYIDYALEAICGLNDGAVYLIGSQEYVAQTARIAISESMFGSTVSIIAKATDANHLDSDAVELHIPSRPAAPVLSVRAESLEGASDGAISGTDSRMEYFEEGENGWIGCPAGDMENLSPGAYLVRFKATDSAFASVAAQLLVDKGETPPPVVIEEITYKIPAQVLDADTAEDGWITLKVDIKPDSISELYVPVKRSAGSSDYDYDYGFAFEGWYVPDELGFYTSPVSEENLADATVLFGKFEDVEYSVSFDTGLPDAPLEKVTIREGKAVAAPSMTARRGYTFEGWYHGDELWDFDAGIVLSDMVLNAHWKANRYVVKAYAYADRSACFTSEALEIDSPIILSNIEFSEPDGGTLFAIAGYSITGWAKGFQRDADNNPIVPDSTIAAGSTTVDALVSFMVDSDDPTVDVATEEAGNKVIELYAIWTPQYNIELPVSIDNTDADLRIDVRRKSGTLLAKDSLSIRSGTRADVGIDATSVPSAIGDASETVAMHLFGKVDDLAFSYLQDGMDYEDKVSFGLDGNGEWMRVLELSASPNGEIISYPGKLYFSYTDVTFPKDAVNPNGEEKDWGRLATITWKATLDESTLQPYIFSSAADNRIS